MHVCIGVCAHTSCTVTVSHVTRSWRTMALTIHHLVQHWSAAPDLESRCGLKRPDGGGALLCQAYASLSLTRTEPDPTGPNQSEPTQNKPVHAKAPAERDDGNEGKGTPPPQRGERAVLIGHCSSGRASTSPRDAVRARMYSLVS